MQFSFYAKLKGHKVPCFKDKLTKEEF